ncbi:hypothetical protein LAUMK13_01975 [Mycobacterium innocens]|uniref:Uncharacterized protein n=1 Tax=Mycobacterium innocens TaxID=2341083 RepID=A0A498Q0P0_9MYCO|nr:hypothetical protein LAUMK13_01975 [Mycobacterium innocens]
MKVIVSASQKFAMQNPNNTSNVICHVDGTTELP